VKSPLEGGVVSEFVVRVHCRENCGVSWDLKSIKVGDTLEGDLFGGWQRERHSLAFFSFVILF